MFLKPGAIGPLVALQDCARELHDAVRAGVLARVKRRAASGAGPDERSDFAVIATSGRALVAAAEQSDAGAVIARARDVLAQVEPPLTDPGEYEPRDALNGVRVRFRTISAAAKYGLQDDLAAANAETSKLPVGSREWRASDAAAVDVVRRALDAMVAELHYEDEAGAQVATTIDDSMVEALQRAGALRDLYQCALEFQDLPPKKAMRFGSSPPSISSDLTATAAAQAESACSDATAAQLSPTAAAGTSSGPTTKQTAAHGGTSSTTPTSSPSSGSHLQPASTSASTRSTASPATP